MKLSELALKLGLKADATEQEIFAKAGAMLLESQQKLAVSQEEVKALHEAAKLSQLKLDGGKFVALSTTPPPAETPAEKELRDRLAKAEDKAAKQELSNVQGEVDRLIKSGRVPPAMKESLSRLLAMQQQAQALSLAQDGKVVSVVFDAVKELRTLLDALPTVTKEQLSQLTPLPLEQAGEASAEKLHEKAMSVADRINNGGRSKKTHSGFKNSDRTMTGERNKTYAEGGANRE